MPIAKASESDTLIVQRQVPGSATSVCGLPPAAPEAVRPLRGHVPPAGTGPDPHGRGDDGKWNDDEVALGLEPVDDGDAHRLLEVVEHGESGLLKAKQGSLSWKAPQVRRTRREYCSADSP
jgi:hypothetical protein